MTLQNALIESAKQRDVARFHKILDQLDAKGVPVIDLPLMILTTETFGAETHVWAWDQIEDWQVV